MICALSCWGEKEEEVLSLFRDNSVYEVKYAIFSFKDFIRPFYVSILKRKLEKTKICNNLKIFKNKIIYQNFRKTVQLYRGGIIQKIIICSNSEDTKQSELYEKCIYEGINKEDVLFIPIEVFHDRKSVEANIVPYYKRKELKYLEFHIADHCNLNCAHCTMFSGLVDEKFADFEETKQGLELLKKNISHIKMIRLMGGEPLLSPILDRFIRMVREIYPLSDIRVVTNGILVKKIPEKDIQAILECNIGLDISLYPPMEKHIDGIRTFLDMHGIRYQVLGEAEKFRTFYNLTGEKDKKTAETNYFKCKWKNNCINLCGHHLAPCFVPFVIQYADQAFSLDINADGILDLKRNDLSAEKIQHFLSEEPFELCKYCAITEEEYTDWHVVKEKERNNIKEWSI